VVADVPGMFHVKHTSISNEFGMAWGCGRRADWRERWLSQLCLSARLHENARWRMRRFVNERFSLQALRGCTSRKHLTQIRSGFTQNTQIVLSMQSGSSATKWPARRSPPSRLTNASNGWSSEVSKSFRSQPPPAREFEGRESGNSVAESGRHRQHSAA